MNAYSAAWLDSTAPLETVTRGPYIWVVCDGQDVGWTLCQTEADAWIKRAEQSRRDNDEAKRQCAALGIDLDDEPVKLSPGQSTKVRKPLSREYLTAKIEKARAAIAFASPDADLSFAKATLAFAETKLADLDSDQVKLSPGFKEELTPIGIQYVIPGCDREPPKKGRHAAQLAFW